MTKLPIQKKNKRLPMNVHGPALKLHRKLYQRKILLVMRFMDAAGLNVHCPRRDQTDNAVQGGKEIVRYLVDSIYLSMTTTFHSEYKVSYLSFFLFVTYGYCYTVLVLYHNTKIFVYCFGMYHNMILTIKFLTVNF